MQRTRSLISAFACTLLFAAGLLCLINAFFGVDLYDEAYWVAFQWRFALGDRPYLDEVSFHQNFAVLIFPLTALFNAVTGSSEGLVLFLRLLFLLTTWAVAAATYVLFRGRVPFHYAIGLATLALLFPIGIPSFSYGTISLYGLYLGGLALFQATQSPRVLWAALGGTAHAFAAACFPTLFPASAAMALATSFYMARPGRFWLAYLTPIVALAAAMLSYAGSDGLRALWASRITLNHADLSVHFLQHARDLFAVPYRPLLAAVGLLWGMAYGYSRWKNKNWDLGSAAALLVPILCAFVVWTFGYGEGFFFAYFGLGGAFLFLVLRQTPETKKAFWLFWLPGLVYGILSVWSGDYGGVIRLGPGMFLSVTATFLFLTRARAGALAFTLSLCLVFAFGLKDFRESPAVSTAEKRVAGGPFRGLWTDSWKADWVEAMRLRVLAFESQGQRILFHPHFPAGYLFTHLRPAAQNVWWTWPLTPEGGEYFLQKYKETSSRFATLAVVVTRNYHSPSAFTDRTDPLPWDQLGPHILQTHSRLFAAPTFQIYLSPVPPPHS